LIFKFAHELIVKVVFVKTVAEPYQRCVIGRFFVDSNLDLSLCKGFHLFFIDLYSEKPKKQHKPTIISGIFSPF
jgi:hypothetical protein